MSIPSNIAEGFERGGVKEFVQFVWVAKASTAELRPQLYLAADSGLITEEELERLRGLAVEIARMLAGLARYLRGSGQKGPKYV